MASNDIFALPQADVAFLPQAKHSSYTSGGSMKRYPIDHVDTLDYKYSPEIGYTCMTDSDTVSQ